MQRPKKHMDFELACSALRQIKNDRVGENVYFNYLGESLLYPHLFELFSLADELGLNSHLITNGSLLSGENLSKLRRANISSIKISHDSSSQQVADIHGNRAFPPEKILANIRALVGELSESKTDIGIVLMTSLPGHDRGITGVHLISEPDQMKVEIEQILELLKPVMPVKSWEEIQPEVKKLDWTWWNPKIRLGERLFLEIRPVLNWANIGLAKGPVEKTTKGYCNTLREKVGILVNGDVVLCCVDYNGENILGNIAEDSLGQILKSELAVRVLEGFDRGEVVLDKCQACLGKIQNSYPKSAISR